MAYQFDTTTRNDMINAIETSIGASPTLEMRSGAVPANAAAADSGVVLASMVLPADWLNAAAAGAKALAGVWSDPSADATGTWGHFRIKQNGTGVVRWQGTMSGPGGGGDLVMDSATVTAGQQASVISFAVTAGGA
jgi:hypothetical protein